MVSLFDYLGKPAGATLGKRVAEYAKKKKAKHSEREVSTKNYTGIVMLYEREFLDEFFNLERQYQEQQRKQYINNDNSLPF